MYNEFYVLLEQIYAGIYNENQSECDHNERNASPESENGEELECIELDTIETTDNQSNSADEQREDANTKHINP